MALTIAPATAEQWEDLAGLFGERGDPSRCWCTWFRRPAKEYGNKEGNREQLRRLVSRGREPGLLERRGARPVYRRTFDG